MFDLREATSTGVSQTRAGLEICQTRVSCQLLLAVPCLFVDLFACNDKDISQAFNTIREIMGIEIKNISMVKEITRFNDVHAG